MLFSLSPFYRWQCWDKKSIYAYSWEVAKEEFKNKSHSMKRQNAAVTKNTMYLKETSWEWEYISSGAPVSLPRPWATSVATFTSPKPSSHSSNYIKRTFIKYTRLFNVFLPLIVLEWLSICYTWLMCYTPRILLWTPSRSLLFLLHSKLHSVESLLRGCALWCDYLFTHLPFLLKRKLLEGSFFQIARHLNTKMSV